MDDSRIIDLFFARAESAIGALDRKYGRLCSRTANNILGNPQDAEECVNDSYLGVWNRVPPTKPDSLRAFLLRILNNICTERLRHDLALKRRGNYQECLEDWADVLRDPQTPESIVEARQLAQYINDFLWEQEEVDRWLFVRRYWYMETATALATAAGMTAGAVRTRLARMRSRLRQHLTEKGVQL